MAQRDQDRLVLKYRYFEYLVDRLIREATGRGLAGVEPDEYLGGEGNFSKLKLLKLLFLVVGVSSERDSTLLEVFNYFLAMPYGPVEAEVYVEMVRSERLGDAGSPWRFAITRDGCRYLGREQVLEGLEGSVLEAVDCAVKDLLARNSHILDCSAFELVTITHLWSCWADAYTAAVRSDSEKWKTIDKADIECSSKYYNRYERF